MEFSSYLIWQGKIEMKTPSLSKLLSLSLSKSIYRALFHWHPVLARPTIRFNVQAGPDHFYHRVFKSMLTATVSLGIDNHYY
jgi:hypothetical protein